SKREEPRWWWLDHDAVAAVDSYAAAFVFWFVPPPLVFEEATVPSRPSVTVDWSHYRKEVSSLPLLVVPELTAFTAAMFVSAIPSVFRSSTKL
ncbi:hypothetical protein PIB30_098056, partial [Stylosanthes scabra]|nr:hypothetical protein [Stylosanthes scabra]